MKKVKNGIKFHIGKAGVLIEWLHYSNYMYGYDHSLFGGNFILRIGRFSLFVNQIKRKDH